MDSPIRRPEEILAYRPLRDMLAGKPRQLWSVAPSDPVMRAVELMAEKHIGCVLVLENERAIGLVSERDCVRRVLLPGRSPQATPVSEIMARNLVTCDLNHTFADCLRLMHSHGIRHLPVVVDGLAVGVVSMRDLAAEAAAHHAKLLAEIEYERLQAFTSTV